MQDGESCVSYTLGLVRSAPHLTRGIGLIVLCVASREVLMLGPNIEWCPDCGKYYNKTAPHDCRGMEIRLNREKLERWLGNYTIKEEG